MSHLVSRRLAPGSGSRPEERSRRGAAPDLHEAVREVPLHQWHHVAGSKVRASDLLRALFEVRRIRARYLR